MTKAKAVLSQNADWEAAVTEACQQLADFGQIDLLFMFASASYRPNLPELVRAIYEKSGAQILLGCSGQAIISTGREIEDKRAFSLLALSLPQAQLNAAYLTQAELDEGKIEAKLHKACPDPNAWMLIADPFHFDAEKMLSLISKEYPSLPLVGGIASSGLRQTYLFFNDMVFEEGAIALAIGGEYTLQTVVSQGATPIGETWMVTAADQNVVESISGRPAYEVMIETIKTLSEAQQQKVNRNLLVGLAVDEYKSDFVRGDFLIRNLMAVDPKSGAIAINALPTVGQTIQFQLRDAAAANEDLTELLGAVKTRLGSSEPVAGVLFSCNGRGVGLFGKPDHDAAAIDQALTNLPLTGFFCNGEIGPIGNKNFLHGFTASLGLFVAKTAK